MGLPMALFCTNCGSLVRPGNVMCVNCGYRFDGEPWTPMNAAPPAKTLTEENKDAPYLPYEPRPMQLDIIADIRSALESHRHIVLESGTGTGKTIVSLAGALEYIKRPENHNMKIIYITRTNSQSDQVMKELKAISALHPVSGITLSGRNKSCPLLMSRPDFASLSPSALSTLCSDRKSHTNQGRAGGCSYYAGVQERGETIAKWAKSFFPKADEFDAYCKNVGICPYESRKLIMKEFDVIVAPYIHIIDPGIRASLFQNLGLDEKDIILIVDEAHNMIEHAREMESFSIPMRLVASAFDECIAFENAYVTEDVGLKDFIRAIRSSMSAIATERIAFGKKEALIPAREFEDRVCKALGTLPGSIDDMSSGLMELAQKRMDAISDTDNPSSPLWDLAVNLEKWVRSPSDRYVKSIKVNDDGEYLSAACIDPSEIPLFFRKLNGSIHMSGTLQPITQYVRVLGLPDNTIPRKYPSPFPAENRRTVYYKDVTTLYSELSKNPGMYEKLQDCIVNLCDTVHKNTMVFFTSYSLMSKFRNYLSRHITKPQYWEESGKSRQTMQMVNSFRREKDAVFFCVMGGSVAEGIDFPGDELEFAIIVGIPYPPPTLESDAMSKMFDSRFGSGKGWEYVSSVPAQRKIRQASGRLIRKETDRGLTVILDNRASRFAKILEAVPTDDPVEEARKFYYGD